MDAEFSLGERMCSGKGKQCNKEKGATQFHKKQLWEIFCGWHTNDWEEWRIQNKMEQKKLFINKHGCFLKLIVLSGCWRLVSASPSLQTLILLGKGVKSQMLRNIETLIFEFIKLPWNIIKHNSKYWNDHVEIIIQGGPKFLIFKQIFFS